MKKGLAGAIAITMLLMFATTVSWAAGSTESGKGPIVVGSKIDTEGGLLGEMIVLLLNAHGFATVDKTQFGPTDVVRKAILSGEIDIYPEYTGNGAFFFQGTDPAVWHNAQKGYETVKKLDLEQNHIVWLTPAPANNTWAIAARKDVAQANGLTSLEDFARYVNSGGKVMLAASEEFVSRPDVLPAFEKTYGFKLSNNQLLVVSGGNTAQTEKAAADRTNGVNFAMAYGTDGALSALGLVVLADTKGVEPVYEPAPIIRESVLSKYPQIAGILAPAFKLLTLETLQKLNAKIAIDGQEAKSVAADFLRTEGLIK